MNSYEMDGFSNCLKMFKLQLQPNQYVVDIRKDHGIRGERTPTHDWDNDILRNCAELCDCGLEIQNQRKEQCTVLALISRFQMCFSNHQSKRPFEENECYGAKGVKLAHFCDQTTKLGKISSPPC